MKAMIISRPGGPEVLQLVERPIPVPGRQQVLIRIKSAGINWPDIMQRKGQYPPPPDVPADIPGLEVAGIIEDCSPDVNLWKKGDAVCVLIAGGGYAEYALAEAAHCLPIPSGWSFTEAASLPETIFTVWHNVFQRGSLKKGETLLVHGGNSGIGTTAIQLAKAIGARVFATAGTDEKCRQCEGLGAEKCINYKEEDFAEVLKAEGADVILDMVGGDYTSKNLRLLKDEGRLVFINGMKGTKAEFDIMDIMRRRLTITGSTLRSRDNEFKAALTVDIRAHVWPLLEQGKFKPIIFKTFKLEEAADAHALIESREHIGKIVLIVD